MSGKTAPSCDTQPTIVRSSAYCCRPPSRASATLSASCPPDSSPTLLQVCRLAEESGRRGRVGLGHALQEHGRVLTHLLAEGPDVGLVGGDLLRGQRQRLCVRRLGRTCTIRGGRGQEEGEQGAVLDMVLKRENREQAIVVKYEVSESVNVHSCSLCTNNVGGAGLCVTVPSSLLFSELAPPSTKSARARDRESVARKSPLPQNKQVTLRDLRQLASCLSRLPRRKPEPSQQPSQHPSQEQEQDGTQRREYERATLKEGMQ